MKYKALGAGLFLVFLIIAASYTKTTNQNEYLNTEKLTGDTIWVDPGLSDSAAIAGLNSQEGQQVIVWFDEQFLGNQNSYLNRSKEFAGWKRTKLREAVVRTLKNISDESFKKAEGTLRNLEKKGEVKNIERHWIVNSFKCFVNSKGLEDLKTVPGIKKIFNKMYSVGSPQPTIGPSYISGSYDTKINPANYEQSWNIKEIGAEKTWRELGITGKGILVIISDFGFKLDVPGLQESIYQNVGEIPANGIDDDNNGFIDDYNGFNFDSNSNHINTPTLRGNSIIHGNVCAWLVSGRPTKLSNYIAGVAPDSKWSPVIGVMNIESSVEWAIEKNADIFSMSFSLPGLKDKRDRWRKIMEQGAFCGIFFVSGAGNFADTTRPSYAPIPEQMRIPEDIPEAVFGVAGVDSLLNRPVFSSQGPVLWQTEHYKEGYVPKPDFATFNKDINYIGTDGVLQSILIRGNSFAGPHLAGVLALILSSNNDLNPWDVKFILRKTSKDIFAPGFDFQSGYGLVDAYEAVKMAIDLKNNN